MPAYSGFWQETGDSQPYSLLVNKSSTLRVIGRALKRRSSTRVREVVDTVAASSSINGGAAVMYARVAADRDVGNPVSGGGQREIETVTKIAASSSTTAADVATVDEAVAFENQPTYPTDASGNGGGGKSASTAPSLG